jgi:uncharacterized protein
MTLNGTIRVGLISDTHGLLRPQALELLQGSDFIVHAGDIGDPEILRRLEAIAPVTAVRGNNDTAHWAARIRETETLSIANTRILVIHDLAKLDIDPVAAKIGAVVSGHSHQPKTQTRDGVLYMNPGSAGPRRFTLPISLGFLEVSGETIVARLIELDR